jgi:hypothetical protein
LASLPLTHQLPCCHLASKANPQKITVTDKVKQMNLLEWISLTPAEQTTALARPALENAQQRSADVARLIAQIRADGDASARALTRRFDGVELDALRVSAAEFDACDALLDEPLKAAMRGAFGRIKRFHAACAPGNVQLETAPGVLCERIVVGIERVAALTLCCARRQARTGRCTRACSMPPSCVAFAW